VTPEEQHQDAVAAAHEWRDQQRERVAADIAAHLPARGESFEIVWPGGPHNFRMEFLYEDPKMAGAPEGWTYLHGRIVQPENWYGRPWSFLMHWVPSKDDDGNDTGRWTMMRHGGTIHDG
jgi:hypothetical protein